MRMKPAMSPTMFGIQTAMIGATAPLRARALPIVISA